MPFLFLFFLFTAVPVFELFLLFKAGSAIGAINTIAIVLITGVVGAALAKSQGLAIFTDLQKQTKQGQLPAESLIHAFLVLAGGLLLLTPGFMTDILGFSMVIPFTRFIFVQFLKAYFAKKVRDGSMVYHVSHDGGFHASSGSIDPMVDLASSDLKEAKVINVRDVESKED